MSCQNNNYPVVPPLPTVPTAPEKLGVFGLKEGISPKNNPITQAEQLVIMLAPNDKSISGQLFLFEKQDKKWELFQAAMPCSLGKHGMAWGSGLLDNRVKQGYRKQEGDKKTPAGIFTFGTAFGYVPKENADFVQFPYTPSDETTFCVDDSNSKYYNQIVSTKNVEKDWNSAEKMNRKDHLYEWGIFVQHNEQQQGEDGSCIHLHVWREKGKYTAGCTAVSQNNMVEILKWLSPNKNPRLIQATTAIYPQLQSWFDLPEVK